MFHSRADRSRDCIFTVLLLAALVGCRDRTAPVSFDDDARQFVRLAVALGERDPDALDFYVGPADLVADIRAIPPPLASIKRDAAELAAKLHDRSSRGRIDATRLQRVVADLGAIETRIDLLTGTRMPYNEESTRFFGVAAQPLNKRELDDVRSRIRTIVGSGGRLVDRYTAFAQRFTIAADRLAPVIDAALAACRQRTAAFIALPPNEHVTVQYVRDRPWSAFTRYVGGARSIIQINTDFSFTVDQALQLACHEGYPGHHTRGLLVASGGGADWPERWVQLTFSPSSLVSEAAAMSATDVAFPAGEREAVERERLFPLAALDARDVEQHIAVERLVGRLQPIQADVARRYIDGELEFERAVAQFEEEALVPHAEGLVKYINQYRSYVNAYTVGPALFSARVAACAGANATNEKRWRCFRDAMMKPAL